MGQCLLRVGSHLNARSGKPVGQGTALDERSHHAVLPLHSLYAPEDAIVSSAQADCAGPLQLTRYDRSRVHLGAFLFLLALLLLPFWLPLWLHGGLLS